jgi:fucose permease
MPQTFHRDRFTWMAYLFLAFYGYFLNVLGPITPFLKDELHLSYTVSSLHFTAFAVGILLVGLGGHVPIRRLGPWGALWIGAAGMSVGALLLVAGRTPVITIGAAFLMGAIGSLILAVVPSALSDRHGELRAVAISEANVIASFVTTAAPLLVGWFAYSIGGWRLALVIVAVALLLMYLWFGRVASPMGPSIQGDPAQAHRPLPTLYWVYWTALVLAVSVEFCMIFWSADYLMTVLGMPKADAAQAVSLFLAGMLLGRLAGSRLVRYSAASPLVIGATLVAALGFLIFWRTGTVILGLSGLFITGLGVASMYPLILSLAMSTAPNNTIQASARATLASGAAILTLPLVLGRLADAIGIRPAYGVVALLLLGVFLMIQFAGAPHPVQPS